MAEINQQPAPNGPTATPSTPTPASTPPPTTAAPATSTSASTVTAQADEGRLRGISRSVIIGVGGTGHQIILAVRKRLIEKYGSLDKLPIVGFALLDTDQAIFSKNPDYDDAVNLDSADKIHCSVHGVDNLRKNLRDHPHLRNWLDPRVLTGDIDQGAGAVRARGRLAYFWNYATIARKLEDEMHMVTKDSSKETAIKNGLQVGEGLHAVLRRQGPGAIDVGVVDPDEVDVRQRGVLARVVAAEHPGPDHTCFQCAHSSISLCCTAARKVSAKEPSRKAPTITFDGDLLRALSVTAQHRLNPPVQCFGSPPWPACSTPM